ncbi:MAG: Shikimate dehydrogenase [Marinimicrobia bacterium 46_47]|nr:MAG: Shikimate dehydrogenase [Marinimicrobia bacterium 46_47]KUK91772.1 MAG: shikimate dehydrogenase [Marinimicrobia bacterium 46_43]HBY18161.1 hypothetical protein [Candidatus Neomarinimicrobiota bacterium]
MKLGLIGHHIAYSISPKLHTLIGRETGLPSLRYERFDIPPSDLKKNLTRLQKEGYTGVNITIPYKKEVLAYTRQQDISAKECGAANTLYFSPLGIQAWNTDMTGMVRILKNGGYTTFNRYVLFGYGGVAPAVVNALKAHKIHAIYIAGRSPEAIRTFCARFNLLPYSEKEIYSVSTLWINATPAGSVNHPDIPAGFQVIPKTGDRFLDLNYAPLPTHFQRYFLKYGIETEDGLGLLIEQALDSQAIWRNDPGIIKKINRESLRREIIKQAGMST